MKKRRRIKKRGKEEMIQWALRALERTQYLSDLESEEEESPPPSSNPDPSSSVVGASDTQASASSQRSSETRRIEEESDGKATPGTGLNRAGPSFTIATHGEPTENPLAVPIKVEEPAPCNNNCVGMANTSDGLVELRTCAVKAETSLPQSLLACLQKLALPTGQVSNELTRGTNTDVGQREEASGSIIAVYSGSSSAQLLEVWIEEEPDARLCYTPDVYEEPVEDPLALPIKTEFTDSSAVKEEPEEDPLAPPIKTEFTDFSAVKEETEEEVYTELVNPESDKTHSRASNYDHMILGDLESLGVPGSRRSPLRECASSACDLLNQQPVQEGRSVNTTVPLVVLDSDSDEAMDVDTVDQNGPAEGHATQDSSLNIPFLENHPCTAQQLTSKSMKEKGHKMENMSSLSSGSKIPSAQPSTAPLHLGDSQHGDSDDVPRNASHRITHNVSQSSHSTSHSISHRFASPFVWQDSYTGATFMVSPLSSQISVPQESSNITGPISVPQGNSNLTGPISVTQGNSNLTGLICVPQGNMNLTGPISVTEGNCNFPDPISITQRNSNLTSPISVPQGNSNLTGPVSVTQGKSNVTGPIPETHGNSNLTDSIIVTHQNTGSGAPFCAPQSNTGPDSESFKIISGTQVTHPSNYTQQPPRSVGLTNFMPNTPTNAPIRNLNLEALPQGRQTEVGKEGSRKNPLKLVKELENTPSTPPTTPNSVSGGRAQNSGRTTRNRRKSRHQSAEQSSLDKDPEFYDNGKNKNTAQRSGMWMCNVCDKMFSSHGTLTMHMKTHIIGRNFKSSDCGDAELKMPNGPVKQGDTNGDLNKRSETKYHLRERSKEQSLPSAADGGDNDDVTRGSKSSDDDGDYKAKSDADEDVSSDEGFYECTGCKKKFLSRQQFFGHLSFCSCRSAPVKRKSMEEKNDQVKKAAPTVPLDVQRQQSSFSDLENSISSKPTKINVISRGPEHPPSSQQHPKEGPDAQITTSQEQMTASNELSSVGYGHDVQAKEQKKAECFKCDEVLTSIEEALKHVMNHFRLRTVSNKCTESGTNQGEIVPEDRVSIAAYLCPLCKKPFGDSIVEHVSLHWPHKCECCESRYAHQALLEEHKKTCVGEKSTCPLCAEGEKDSTILPMHMLLHVQNICPVCGEPFLTLYDVWKHLETHFKTSLALCKLCGQSFREDLLRTHMVSDHSQCQRGKADSHRLNCSTQRGSLEGKEDQLLTSATTVPLSTQQQQTSFNFLQDSESSEPPIINADQPTLPKQHSKESCRALSQDQNKNLNEPSIVKDILSEISAVTTPQVPVPWQNARKKLTFSKTTAPANFQGYSSTLQPILPKTPQNMKSALNSYSRSSGKYSKEVKCFKCKEIITTVEEGLEHNKRHFGLKKVRSHTLEGGVDKEETEEYDSKENAGYLCPLCEKPLGFGSAIVEHILSHWPHKCDSCERRYSSSLKLVNHKNECTGKTQNCPLCAAGSRDSSKHLEHLLTHIVNICPVCGNAFHRLYNVKNHLANHLNICLFFCKLCNESFTDSGILCRHIMMVHRKEPFRCTRCDKNFPTDHILRRHRMICKKESVMEVKGSNTKQFQCDNCKRLFQIKWQMANHIRTVCYKELFRNYQCKQCNRWGYSTFWLNTHVKANHTKTLCEICGKVVKNMSIHMETHLRSLKKNFKCSDCGDTFRQKDHLKVHIRKHTSECPYQCEECGNRFKTVGHLINHRETHKPLSERLRMFRKNAPVTRFPKS